MRRSDEEFKAELMLRVKKHRAAQKRRKKAWITAATAAAGLVIVMAVKMPGIFGISTESVRETAPGRTEITMLEEVSERGEIHTEIARDVVENVPEGCTDGNCDRDEYYYAGMTESAVIDGMTTESLQAVSVWVEGTDRGSEEYNDPAVAERLLSILQSFQAAEEAFDEAESGSRDGNETDTEEGDITVTVWYADGTEYCYTLQRGTDFWIIRGENNAQISMTEAQWEQLNALLEEISAEGGKS